MIDSRASDTLCRVANSVLPYSPAPIVLGLQVGRYFSVSFDPFRVKICTDGRYGASPHGDRETTFVDIINNDFISQPICCCVWSGALCTVFVVLNFKRL